MFLKVNCLLALLYKRSHSGFVKSCLGYAFQDLDLLLWFGMRVDCKELFCFTGLGIKPRTWQVKLS